MTRILPDDSTLRLGLGCSRLGSVNGTSGNEARALLQEALSYGVRFFDTSNIYAQGDSERYLGEVIGNRQDCVICSKGGKYLPLGKRVLVPVKGLLRLAARRSGSARDHVRQARANPMPTCWEADFLIRNIEASLKRLQRERIDVYMLHSAPEDILNQGQAVAALDQAREAGKIGLIGVSVDTPQAAMAALGDARVKVLQLPIHAGDRSYDAVLNKAKGSGVAVVAREILGGARAISGETKPGEHVATRLGEIANRSDIALPLIGTTKPDHLRQAVAAIRQATQESR